MMVIPSPSWSGRADARVPHLRLLPPSVPPATAERLRLRQGVVPPGKGFTQAAGVLVEDLPGVELAASTRTV